MSDIIDIAIIGGGAAGLSAGIYGARASLNTVLFEELFPGGQTATVELIENYPGFAEGIEGSELMMAMNTQATNAGMQTRYEKIVDIKKGELFTLIGEEGQETMARSVIICSGATPRKMDLENEEKLTGRGVHYCATCDGAFYKGKTVAIYGGGNTAVTDALVLSNYAEKVYLIYRGKSLRADKVLQNKLNENEKIEVLWESVITGLNGDNQLTSLAIENTATKEASTLNLDGLFVAIGITPRSEFVTKMLELNEAGQIITNEELETSVKGIYAAGDVRNTKLRQVVTAAADGALAATMAMEHIKLM